jgi:hypothetical protein
VQLSAALVSNSPTRLTYLDAFVLMLSLASEAFQTCVALLWRPFHHQK